jgi:protein phosphatase 2C family protein 2/3
VDPVEKEAECPSCVLPSWSFGSHGEQNTRTHMEDRVLAQDLSQHPRFVHRHRRAGFFAVFDGHSGHEAAEYLSNNLLNFLLTSPDLLEDPKGALQRAVERAEQEIVAQFSESCCNAGSTLLALLLLDDKMVIANVGDCRAVLAAGAESRQLTRDHKPGCQQEQERIAQVDPEAVITADGYLYGELAVARGIGSQHLKLDPSKRGFTFEPEMHTVQLAQGDDFVVLATDGLWDKVTNKEVVGTARRSLAGNRDPGVCARALVDRAQRMQSHDNISVVILCLHARSIILTQTNSRLMLSRKKLGGAESSAPPPQGA